MVVPLNHPCSKDFPLPSSCWGTVIAQIKASAKAHVQRRTSRPPVRRCANCHLCCPRPPAPVAAGRDQSPQPRGPTLGGKWSFLQQGLTNEGYVCIYIWERERLYLFSELCFHLFAWIETNMSDCQTCWWPKKIWTSTKERHAVATHCWNAVVHDYS